MGKLLTTFAVFLACMLIAHIPVWYGQHQKRRGRFNEATWKRRWEASDYLWLALTTLGLFGVTGEARRMVGVNDLKNARVRAEDHVHRAIQSASAARSGLQVSPPDVPGIKQALEAMREAERSAVSAFPDWGDANSSISTTEEDKVASLLDRAIEKYDTAIMAAGGIPDQWADERQRIQTDIRQARDCMRDVKDALARSRKDDFDALLTAFAPWILAAGLALRFAKVTAKLKGQV